jgi:hypothetical protein
MLPLSCVNCCHNPLQLGAIGTPFGYCTRHRVVLNQPHLTTCGQLLRKDLLAESAERESAVHRTQYRTALVVLVAKPSQSAEKLGLVEKANGQLPADPVFEELKQYGSLDSKIASMAALKRVPGARAEIARLSLSRAYFRNCIKNKGSWTAGLHLLFWTLQHLDEEPVFAATDVRGPIVDTVSGTIAAARWTLLAFRLAFIGDVGRIAERDDDPAGRLAKLPVQAITAAGDDPDKLLEWLGKKKPSWSSALPPNRYEKLSDELRREHPEE